VLRRGLGFALPIALCLMPAVAAATMQAKAVPDVVFAGQTEEGLPGYIKLLPHSAGVSAAFAYTTSCTAGDGSILWSGVAKAPIRGGHFHFVRKEDANGPQITLDGRIGPGGVSGTWHVHFTERTQVGSVTDICDSGTVAWSLPRDGAGGQLARAYPVALRLAKGNVKTLDFVTRVKCKSGDSYLIPSFYDNFRVAKDGTFGRTFKDKGVPTKGITPNMNIAIHGQIKRGQLQGTWRLKVVFTDSAGKDTDTCDSGPLTWSATA
jgi:hypothetical protein